jgi:hypothetical protein
VELYLIVGGVLLLPLWLVISTRIARGQYQASRGFPSGGDKERRNRRIVVVWVSVILGAAIATMFATPALREDAPIPALAGLGVLGFMFFIEAARDGKISERAYIVGRLAFPFVLLGLIFLFSRCG